jgi:hypothetical protein
VAFLVVAASGVARAQVVIYQDSNYGGSKITLTADAPRLSSMSFNDKASSIKLGGVASIAVYKDSDYNGTCQTIDSDIATLVGSSVGNDTISSVKLYTNCEGTSIGLPLGTAKVIGKVVVQSGNVSLKVGKEIYRLKSGAGGAPSALAGAANTIVSVNGNIASSAEANTVTLFMDDVLQSLGVPESSVVIKSATVASQNHLSVLVNDHLVGYAPSKYDDEDAVAAAMAALVADPNTVPIAMYVTLINNSSYDAAYKIALFDSNPGAPFSLEATGTVPKKSTVAVPLRCPDTSALGTATKYRIGYGKAPSATQYNVVKTIGVDGLIFTISSL